jgi:hypothetical protein
MKKCLSLGSISQEFIRFMVIGIKEEFEKVIKSTFEWTQIFAVFEMILN